MTKVPGKTDAAARPAAVVIPFPARRPKAVPDAHARLARAVESLDAALKNQRVAVAAWRDVLKDLKSTTVNLDESLQRYRASLRSLGSSVSALQAKARAMEEWAGKTAHLPAAQIPAAQSPAGHIHAGPVEPQQVTARPANGGQALHGQGKVGQVKVGRASVGQASVGQASVGQTKI